MTIHGRAVVDSNPLSSTLPQQEQQYQELLEFKKESQNGIKNSFICSTERVIYKSIIYPASDNTGGFVPPLYIFGAVPFTIVSTQQRRMENIPRAVILDITLAINQIEPIPSNSYFFDFPVYVTAFIFEHKNFDFIKEPLLCIYAGNMRIWGNAPFGGGGFKYDYPLFKNQLILNNTITQRMVINSNAGLNAYDFTNNPDKLTEEQYKKYIINGESIIYFGFSYFYPFTPGPFGSSFLDNLMQNAFQLNATVSISYYSVISNFYIDN